ncbi:ABC transporter permease subunit [Alkalimarinus alittae]|uniref:ABC transporter permease subunit n=1 Tax=Alkalimarinus alittae TaxID=2961619 RepID=A0ABY6N2G3_9ALTE|nr:ABC transporter permease subunit [Alkalimarinus alittae]UZE96273.1 ABC transporter permease subunit [Alkalimarinus alittae]
MKVAGWVSFFLTTLITVLAFQGLIGFSDYGADWALLTDSYFHSILIFSLKQALLSALLSVVLAWPIARALYYLPNLPAHRVFLAFCLLCFVMPTLVLITGLVSLLGRSGVVSPWLVTILGDWNLYGLNGILLAHIYLNMPFAVRVFYQQFKNIPDSSWTLSMQLKLSRWQRLRIIEWRSLRGSALVMFGFIFVLCFNSFAIVLALGGGPKSTTLEVAIYQALKYDFNIAEALMLAWVQLLIAGGLFLMVSRFGNSHWLSVDTAREDWRPIPTGWRSWLMKGSYYLVWLALLLPVLALFAGVTQGDLLRIDWGAFIKPTLITLGLGILSASLGMGLAYAMLTPIRQLSVSAQPRKRVLLEWLATHALVAPAMVISVGLFIFLLPIIDIDRWGIVFVAILNTALVVPFAIQKLKPRLYQFDDQYDALTRSLKLKGLQRWAIEWPFIRSVFLSTYALVLVLSMGDVAIFSIFGTSDWTTLPWLIYGYAGTYRIAEASIASIVLLVLCVFILWLFEKVQSRHA